MRNREVLRNKSRIDNLFVKIDAFSSDIELQAHWSRYMCVMVSGFLETSVSAIFSDYAKKRASPYVANLVTRRLAQFTNPNTQKIVALASAFNPQWAASLEKEVDGEIKNAIDSICNNRNLIAHGKDSGISFVRLRDWYGSAAKIVDLLESHCERS